MPDSSYAQVQRELFLRTFFDAAPPAELAELLAARMQDRVYEREEIIYEKGSESGPMYFIADGQVALEAPGDEPWLLEAPAFIGGIDANAEQPHRRTARALSRVHVIKMHFQEYLSVLEDFFDFAKSMLVQGAHRTWESSMRVAPDRVFGPSVAPDGRWLALDHLDDVQRIMVLRSSRAFERAPVQALVTLARFAREVRYRKNERLWTAGDLNDGMHIVVDGRVRSFLDDPLVEGLVGPGDFAQGVIEIAPKPKVFSAEAESDVVLLSISHEDLFDAMEEHFGLARSWWVYMGRENHRVRMTFGQRTGDLRRSA